MGEVPIGGNGTDVRPENRGGGGWGRNTRYTDTHLSRVLGTLPLGRWSYRHQQCFGISGHFQPGPEPGTGPSLHLWAGPRPQPRHLWCCLPGGGSRCRHLWDNHGGQCPAGVVLIFHLPSLRPPHHCNLLPFGNRTQTTSGSKNFLPQRK